MTCYSDTAVRTAGHAQVQAEFIPVPCWDFRSSPILRHPGERANSPWKGAFSWAPLAEQVIDARSFASATEGCCVGRTWGHREAAAAQVELGSRNRLLGIL